MDENLTELSYDQLCDLRLVLEQRLQRVNDELNNRPEEE